MKETIYSFFGGVFIVAAGMMAKHFWNRFLKRSGELQDEHEKNQNSDIQKNKDDLAELAKELRASIKDLDVNERSDVKDIHARITKIGERLNELDQARYLEEPELKALFGEYQKAVWEYVAIIENDVRDIKKLLFSKIDIENRG